MHTIDVMVYINSLAHETVGLSDFEYYFQGNSRGLRLRHLLWNCAHVIDLSNDKSAFGLENGFVAPGNKPIFEPILTHIYVPMWRH